ncbi:MAG: nitroreductase family protein [Chloroflexi bacterium]|nr:nitroreductase family protein [Chloroflexota bacterium]
MLSVKEAIQQRRSIRRFRPDPFPEEHLFEILEAARLAPSGGNAQPWRFIVVTDPEEKKKICKMALEQKFLEEAPVVIVCCADLAAYTQASRRVRLEEFAQYGVLETLSGRVGALQPGAKDAPEPPEDAKRRSALSNSYIAIEHMVLTATALGLGTCWVGAIGARGELNALFNIPESIVPIALLPVGYPAVVPHQRPRLSMEQILLRPLATIAPPKEETRISITA